MTNVNDRLEKLDREIALGLADGLDLESAQWAALDVENFRLEIAGRDWEVETFTQQTAPVISVDGKLIGEETSMAPTWRATLTADSDGVLAGWLR